MASVVGDRVRETSTSTGTGTITLLGAVANFRAFSSIATANGDTFFYAIVHQSVSEWEVGVGERLSSTTFQRNTILSSSNGGLAVSFSAGTKDVFMTLPADNTVLVLPTGVANVERLAVNVTNQPDGTDVLQGVSANNSASSRNLRAITANISNTANTGTEGSYYGVDAAIVVNGGGMTLGDARVVNAAFTNSAGDELTDGAAFFADVNIGGNVTGSFHAFTVSNVFPGTPGTANIISVFHAPQNATGGPSQMGLYIEENYNVIRGAIEYLINAYAADTTITDLHNLVFLDATSNDVTYDISTVPAQSGRIIRVKRTDTTAFKCTIDSGSGNLIDDFRTFSLEGYQSVDLAFFSGKWNIVSEYDPNPADVMFLVNNCR